MCIRDRTSAALLLGAVLVYFFYVPKTAVIKIRGGSVHLQKFNTPAAPYYNTLPPEDSLKYGAIIADYGYYWEATPRHQKVKRVAFDRNSGTILWYENPQETSFHPAKPNRIFQWDFNDTTPNLIKGIYGWTDKDTTMCWIYDTQKQLLIDEKGICYKRKNITQQPPQ
jgi:hypothetical protein